MMVVVLVQPIMQPPIMADALSAWKKNPTMLAASKMRLLHLIKPIIFYLIVNEGCLSLLNCL